MAKAVLFLCVVLLMFVVEGLCLKPGGKNVLTKYVTYYVTVPTTTKRLSYRKTCTQTCTLWIFCSTKCRYVPFYRWIAVNKQVQKRRPVYECKQGWKANGGDECTTPICVGGCKNYGFCKAPNTCHCRHGFLGQQCHIGEPCVKIHAPVNGEINCTGNTTDHVCYFKCSPGYELLGSTSRNCSGNNTWTSEETTCKIIHCPVPVADNGFVYSPCRTEFNSKCVVGCAYGYFVEGTSRITCDASGIWEPRNVSCKEIKACQPNPCKNGGKCSPISSSRYSCDCSQTGYKGSNCEIGYIVTPTYPTLTRDILSTPLQFQSSPPSGHVKLMPKCSGIEFKPPYLIFTTTSTRQFINITAKQPGLYFVKYLLSGLSAVNFEPPEKDIVFVEEAQNSTNKTTGESSSLRHFTLPVGCHKLELGKCPRGSDVIVSSSTSSWKARGLMTSTDGVVTLEVGKTVLPLSLLGASVKSKNSSSDEKGCEAFQSNYSSEELIKSNVLTHAFLEAFQSSLPSWLVIALPQRRKSKSFFKSDARSLFLSDSELRRMDVGKGQPLIDKTTFSLLLSRNINLTVEGDTDILGSYHKSPFAMAVDLCSPSPKTVIVRPASTDLDDVKSISIFKRLMMNGWDLTMYSLQISRTRSIEKLEKGLYWNGEDFMRIDSATKGNLALVSSLKKSFRNQGIVNCHVIFDGTMVIEVDNLDNVLHSPLNQKWSVDLYGNTKLTIEFEVEGKKTNVTLNAPHSISYATFGGSLQENISVSRSPAEGLYVTNVLEECPFLQSDLGNFIELGTNKMLSVFIRTKLQPTDQKGNRSENGGVISSVSMAFRGHLKFGPLRFEDVDIQLLTQQSNTSSMLLEKADSSIELKGIYRDNVPKLGIFKTVPFYPRLHIARKQNGSSWGSFQSVVKFLGFEKQVNVSFSENGLNFNTSGMLHGLYDAQMTCHSRLASWEDQRFATIGEFWDKSGGLIEALDKALLGYGTRVLNRATRRVTAFKLREERAIKRVQNILNYTETKRREMSKAEEEYMAAEKSLKAAELGLKNLERTVSDRLTRLRLKLAKLCHVKQCRDVCREGVVCRKCDYEVAGKSKETCLDSCHKTEQRRIRLNDRSTLCEKHDCKRIYLKSGSSRSCFENTMAKITQKLFSYGIKSSNSPSNDYPTMKDVGSSYYAQGNSNEDVCTSRNIPRNLDGPVLSNPFEDFGMSGFHGKKMCRKDSRNGYWDCRVRSEKCDQARFEYENYQKRYTCERSCEVHVTTEIVPKSCCSTVPCAFSIVNVTCVAENVLCSKARSAALKKVVHSPNSSAVVLEKLESARSNVSYWKITKRRAGAMLSSASNSLNISQEAVRNLIKAYNITVESRENISKILAGPLRLKELLDDPLKSIVKIKEVRFNVRIGEEDGPTVLPVQVRFNLNGSQQELSAVIDFKNLNTSFKSIAKDILNVYMGRALTGNIRRKLWRSTEESRNLFAVDTSNKTVHHTISSLQKYHKLCSEFTNFERSLYEMIMSLYNLTSETKQLINKAGVRTNTSEQFNTSSVLGRWRMNETIAVGFGLNISKNVSLSSLETDRVLVEALRLENEAVKDGFKPLHLTSELLFRNWYSAMENIFGVVIKNCSGFDDCVAFILDSLFEMHEDADVPGADVVQQKLIEVRTMLFNLIQSLDLSIVDAAEISSNILRVLNDIKEVKSFCAHSPNITKHPKPFTEMGVARTLVLVCNATGDALVYKWRFNRDLLDDQTTNVLLIRNTTVSHGGNYTCEVSNHISKEVSTPALVVVHPSPSIIVQPVDSLNVVLFSNDSLLCKAQSSDDRVVYQWRFKSLNSTTFLRLPNETFPHLKFSPMKAQHEGWYFCNVSNSYGFSISKTSFVKALRSSLTLPTLVMSLSVTSTPIANATVFRRSAQGNAHIYAQMLHLLSVVSGHVSNATNPRIKDLRLVSCASIKSAQTRARTTAETCRWKFDYVGGNTTIGNSSANKTFQMSAENAIHSARDVQRVAERMLNATNNGVLSFTSGNRRYILEPYSFTVEKFTLTCGPGQQLIQEIFKCVECPSGYYGERNTVGVATCQPCPLGFYQTNTGQMSCMECSEGFTTVNQGSNDEGQCKVICPAGQYGRVSQNIGQCLQCPLGTYQPKEGQFKCLVCPAGRVTAEKGAEDVSKCIPKPTERYTTEEQTSTERPTTEKQTSTERPRKHTTEKQTSTGRHTTEKQASEATQPTAGKLVNLGTNYAPAIGGGTAGFVLLLGLLTILFLLLRRKRRSSEDIDSNDKKEIVRPQTSLELTNWRENPAYSEDGDFLDQSADTVNPAYQSSGSAISPSNEQGILKNPIYVSTPGYHNPESLDEKPPPEVSSLNDESDSDLKLYNSYDNGFATNFENPLYTIATENPRKEIKLDSLDEPITDENA